MKHFLCCACVCLVIFGEAVAKKKRVVGEATAKPQEEQLTFQPKRQPNDNDLFKRDEEVFSLHAEFLFWRVEEGALDYALKMKHPAWGVTPAWANGEFKRATFNGEPGFRVMASFFRAPKYWEIWGSYTRLTATGKDESGKPTPDQDFLTGTWPEVIIFPLAGAQSWIHLNYNTGELLVDRFFNPNPHLRLRLIGGGLVAWIDQFWKIQYNNSTDGITKISSRWNYIAGGFRGGAMADWYWGYNIYVTALATTGITLGTYENKTKQTTNVAATPGSDDTNLPVRDAKYSDVRPAFTVQVQFGPSWQKNFEKSRWEVFAGYELNTWLNLQEVFRSSSSTASQEKETFINTGALTLQGLTTRLSVDF